MKITRWVRACSISLAALMVPASIAGIAGAQAPDAAMAACEGNDLQARILPCTEVVNRGPNESPINRVKAHYYRGISYYYAGEYDRAIADQNEVIRIVPGLVEAYIGRGWSFDDKGDHDRAIVDFTQAIQLNPQYAAAYVYRGFAYTRNRDYPSAIADYNNAILLNPQIAQAYYRRGVVRFKIEQSEVAFADFDQAVALAPGDWSPYYFRGNANMARRDYDRAIADYGQALRIDPLNSFAAEKLREAEVGRAGSQQTTTRPPVPGIPEEAGRAQIDPVRQAPGSLTAEQRVALVIGNADYTTVSDLVNPPRDADTIAATLRASGFTVVVKKNLGRGEFRETLKTFSTIAEDADWAMIYFAGHGFEIDGDNYMVPVDANLRSDIELQTEAVPLNLLLASVQSARKLRLVILDACRNDPFIASISPARGRGLARVEVPKGGTLVAFSAAEGQVALDGDGMPNSPYAAALAFRIANNPGVEINLLFGMVRDDVLAATAQTQIPYIETSLPGEPFFFRLQ